MRFSDTAVNMTTAPLASGGGNTTIRKQLDFLVTTSSSGSLATTRAFDIQKACGKAQIQPQIIASTPFLAQNQDLRCVLLLDPSTLTVTEGAGSQRSQPKHVSNADSVKRSSTPIAFMIELN